MKSTLSNLVIFTVGAAIGSAVTWKLLKTKYERIAQEEIDSVKEVFANRGMRADVEPVDDTVEADGQIDIREYAAKLSEQSYVNYADSSKTKEEAEDVNKPYVISPDEFGEMYGYETISLTYYEDGVLTDDQDEPVEDVDDVVGLDSLNTFGKYEDDSVFVRNDRLKADYEILLDERKYSDVINRSPHRAEDK